MCFLSTWVKSRKEERTSRRKKVQLEPTGKFVQADLNRDKYSEEISFSWSLDEEALLNEERYDGTFTLLSNYQQEQFGFWWSSYKISYARSDKSKL